MYRIYCCCYHNSFLFFFLFVYYLGFGFSYIKYYRRHFSVMLRFENIKLCVLICWWKMVGNSLDIENFKVSYVYEEFSQFNVNHCQQIGFFFFGSLLFLSPMPAKCLSIFFQLFTLLQFSGCRQNNLILKQMIAGCYFGIRLLAHQ